MTRCWDTDEGIKCNVADITYDEISGGDVNDLGYYGYFNGLGGVVGGLAMDGDPWWLGGTSFEIDENLTVNGNSYLSDTFPRTTLMYSLGSGALRWLKLWVQDINAEDIDAYNLHLSENLTVDGYVNVTAIELGGIAISSWDAVNQSGGSTYNQSLNTHDNVTFTSVTTNNITAQGGTSSIIYDTSVGSWGVE